MLLQSVVRTFSLPFSHYQCLTPTSCFFLASPEQVPGTRLGTPKNSFNRNAIVGGAVGGVAIITIVAIVLFLLRRRRARVPVPPPVVGPSRPPFPIGAIASRIPGAIGSLSAHGTHLVPIRTVRISSSSNQHAFACAHVSCPFFF